MEINIKITETATLAWSGKQREPIPGNITERQTEMNASDK
jgi:hypothetical protein